MAQDLHLVMKFLMPFYCFTGLAKWKKEKEPRYAIICHVGMLLIKFGMVDTQIELVLWNHFDVAMFAAFLSYRFVVVDLRGCIALSIQPRHLFIPTQVIIDFYDTLFNFKEVYIGSLGYVRYRTLGTSENWNCTHLDGLRTRGLKWEQFVLLPFCSALFKHL